jgi:hypothetical protein
MTPPLELLVQWESDCLHGRESVYVLLKNAYAAGAQAGADMELEACCEWLREAKNHGFGYECGQQLAGKFRSSRRPKPLSLKEQALNALNEIEDKMQGPTIQEKLIRRALEALPND